MEFGLNAPQVEEAILPLVSAVEQRNKQILPFSEDHQEVKISFLFILARKNAKKFVFQLAYFDENFKLQLHRDGWEKLRLNSSKLRISSSVALLGDTHVGKSTILSQLLHYSDSPPDWFV